MFMLGTSLSECSLAPARASLRESPKRGGGTRAAGPEDTSPGGRVPARLRRGATWTAVTLRLLRGASAGIAGGAGLRLVPASEALVETLEQSS